MVVAIDWKTNEIVKEILSRLTPEQILSTVKNGKGRMPSGLVNEEEVKLLADWLSQKK